VPRLRLAQGGIVEALKAYDRTLRVRWSFEKNKWCIETPHLMPHKMVPPVVYETIPGTKQRVEHLLAEASDRYIWYRDKMAPVLFCSELTWDVYIEVVKSDQARYRSRNELHQRIADIENAPHPDAKRQREDRVRGSRDRFNYEYRKNPLLW
jgi:hypothetical protein